MRDDIKLHFLKIRQEDQERDFRTFMENARNAMRAVKVCIQEGDEDEAIRLINEALGESDEQDDDGDTDPPAGDDDG